MKYSLNKDTFEVRELFNPSLKESGKYYYYVLEKSGISHKEAKKRIGVKSWFCGVKDKNAKTKQWFCTEEAIEEVNFPDFKVKYRGCSSERIFVGKHKGNVFSVKVEFEEGDEKALKHFKATSELVCNYFGEQRFSKNNIETAKFVFARDYESALKVFLTSKSVFDSEKSSRIKKAVAEKWGNWESILNDAEVSGTKKAVLFEFLKNNPTDFVSAFLHAEPKSVGIMVKAAQAMRFNEALNKLAVERKPKNINAQIMGQDGFEKPFFMRASKAFTREITIEPTEFEKNFRKSALVRKTFFSAKKFNARKISETSYELNFELGRGEYATVFLKFLSAWILNSKKS